MKKYRIIIIICFCLQFICLIAGFIIAASKPDNVFAGIGIMLSGWIPGFIAILFTVKYNRLQKEKKTAQEKDLIDKIKKLEEEVESLKKK